jgi:hypothetical protein
LADIQAYEKLTFPLTCRYIQYLCQDNVMYFALHTIVDK